MCRIPGSSSTSPSFCLHFKTSSLIEIEKCFESISLFVFFFLFFFLLISISGYMSTRPRFLMTPGLHPSAGLLSDLNHNVQAVQTDIQTAELAVNTEAGWESDVAAMFDQGSSLKERFEQLAKREEEEEAEHEKLRQQLQKKKEDATRQHQVWDTHTPLIRLSCRLPVRLAKELQDMEQKLTALGEEQGEEQRRWGSELEELRREMDRVRREVREAQRQAQRDEIAAVEKQREVAIQYLNTLRQEFPQQFPQERLTWEKNQSLVRRSQAELQSRFQDVLQQLQQGRDLDSLPRVSVPALPQVPMVTLRSPLRSRETGEDGCGSPPVLHSVACSPQSSCPRLTRPPAGFLPQRLPHFCPQRLPHLHPNLQYRGPYHPPPFLPPHPAHPFPPPPHFRPLVRAPVRSASPSPSPPPPAAPAPAPSAPAGKLDKVLEKLGARFPQCTRAQLTSLLQQVKSSRGTLAGMSMEEVVEQVGFKLAQGERSAPGPSPSPQHARKLCLMCQNHVEPESRHPLACSHTIHRDCIQVWLQSSRNNSCPFCPSK
uniref:RING-type domain-containing protein n=1 Tax=Salarias fasciatus TaxID=181472 RepID=A0A672IPB4_SALFA